MTTNLINDVPQDFQAEMDFLLSIFASSILRGATADEAVAHIAKNGALFAPAVAATINRTAGVDSFFRILARAMWNATPQPSHDFKLVKLPEPGRNDPCFCGSLRKFKQCCAGAPDFPIEPSMMLDALLMAMPYKDWSSLAHSHINRETLLNVAWQWCEDGAYENVVRLLEPWFKGEAVIPNQHAELLDTLLGVYLELDNPRKRKSLAQAAISRGEREVKYMGWQRLALMETDAGNHAAARAAMNEAMRASPDNPDLAILEIQCLMAEGKAPIARERAKFWHTKLARLRDPALKEGLDWLLGVIENPNAAMFKVAAMENAELDQLQAQMQALATPQCHYQLEIMEGSTGPFEPTGALTKALLKWSQAFPVNKPLSTHVSLGDNDAAWDNPQVWLAVLKDHPILWDSFDALDDIIGALDSYQFAGVVEALVPVLLNRAELLFNLAMTQHQASALKCEWGFLENRPALRMLARKAFDNEHSNNATKRDAAFELMLRLVLIINPNDNHGLRANVMAGLITRGRASEAITLAARYPEDMSFMEYNRVLAFYAADRIAEAKQAAQYAFATYPRVGKMLIEKSPRKPKMDSYGYARGSLQESWLYREDFLECWQSQAGALDWLRTLKK